MPAGMTRIEAAEYVLKFANKPMKTCEIVSIGFKNRLFERDDKSMVRALNEAIHNDSRNSDSSRIMSLGDGRYALAEWGLKPVTIAPTMSTYRRRFLPEDDLNRRVDDRMREIQACISGISSLSADRICLLIEFCYLLDLHHQAIELHKRLDRREVEQGWLMRVDQIARAARMKAAL